MRLKPSKEIDNIFKLYNGYYTHTPVLCCYKKYNNFYVAISKSETVENVYSIITLEKINNQYIKRPDLCFPNATKDAFKWIIRLIIKDSKK